MRCPGTPLVVARSGSTVRSIVACVDGSAHARAAVQALCDLPWISGREVTVLTILDATNPSDEHAEAAASALESAGASARIVAVDPDLSGVRPSPTYAILDQLDMLQPQLVALGTRGLTGLRRLAIGSVAGAVAHAGPSRCCWPATRSTRQTGPRTRWTQATCSGPRSSWAAC